MTCLLGLLEPALIRGLDGWFQAGACTRCTRSAGTQRRTAGRQVSWFREECASARGKKVCGPPLQQGGKRRSRPLPTKATSEDVDECGCEQTYPNEIWQRRVSAINVWRLVRGERHGGLVEPRRILPMWLLKTTMPRRLLCCGCRRLPQIGHKCLRRSSLALVVRNRATVLIFASLFEEARKRTLWSRHCCCRTVSDPAPMLCPVLPGGASRSLSAVSDYCGLSDQRIPILGRVASVEHRLEYGIGIEL